MLDHSSSRHKGMSLTPIPNNSNKIIIMMMIIESPSTDPVTENRVGWGNDHFSLAKLTVKALI